MATGSPLGRLFGRSPIAPLQRHMQVANDVVQLLLALQSATKDVDRRRELHVGVLDSARKARDLHRELRQDLPRGLWLAVPRPDLLALLDLQQHIVGDSQRAADSLALRVTAVPAPLDDGMACLGNAVGRCADLASATIGELDELVVDGFGDQERERMGQRLNELASAQDNAGASHREVFSAVADLEATLPPLDAMFLYRINDELAAVARACGLVGEQLRLLIAD